MTVSAPRKPPEGYRKHRVPPPPPPPPKKPVSIRIEPVDSDMFEYYNNSIRWGNPK